MASFSNSSTKNTKKYLLLFIYPVWVHFALRPYLGSFVVTRQWPSYYLSQTK